VRRSHAVRLALAALAALVLLGTVLVSIWSLPFRKPAGAGGKTPTARAVPEQPALPDPSQPGGPVASLLSVARPGDPSRLVVSLRPAGFHGWTPNGADESVMAHEIVRQAVLVVARDAGAVTRDASVGDPVPDAGAPADLEVGSSYLLKRVPVAILARPAAGGREVLATFELGRPIAEFHDYATLIERAEALTRDPDGFPKVLAKVGVQPAAARPTTEGPLGADIEKRLSRMNFLDQFAAVRALHAEVRGKGESADRLGALARAYANLGLLTDFQWNNGHKAFWARALLLAQRGVARAPRSPTALWDRAYARALVGFHKDALADLSAAEALAKGGPKAPSWVPLIDALCRFQTKSLSAARSGPDGQLAMLLAFMTVQDSAGSLNYPVSIGRAVLDDNPECFRVHDQLCRYRAVANGHLATMAALQAFAETVPPHLKELPGLPEPAAARLREGALVAEVAKVLTQPGTADEPGEPSWPSLARMLGDTSFAQAMRRVVFMKQTWNVPTDGFVAEAMPLVVDHPYRPLFESFAVSPSRDRAKFAALLDAVNIPDVAFAQEQFVVAIAEYNRERHKLLIQMMVCHGDTFYSDLARLTHWVGDPSKAELARQIEDMSPYANLSKSMLVLLDWAYAEPRAAEWEAKAGDSPDVLMNLGRKYAAMKRWPDAVRCLEKAVALSPELPSFQGLAETYKSQGDLDRWKATLERALQADDPGLGHMQIRVELANHHRRLKQYDKALPYAEAAAATWAGAGMACAAQCREAMGDWEQSELWQRRITERYPDSSWMGWFIWCRRTGHGDLAAARAFAKQHVASLGENPSDGVREWVATFHLLDGSPREALPILRSLDGTAPNTIRGFMIAALADELGDVAGRDRALAGLLSLPETKETKLDGLVRVIRDGLAAGGGGHIDKAAFVAAVNEGAEAKRSIVAVFAAKLLHAHGDSEKAADILHQLIPALGNSGWAQTVAQLSLRDWEKPSGKVDPKPSK
jgi:tetratricopeptide (TPR) repeat protein